MKSEKNDRIDWLDGARGIGILLVILGHSQAVPFAVRSYIYMFHMPFFFFSSGLFIKKYLHHAPGAFLKEKARAYLVPYLTCELLLNGFKLFLTAAALVVPGLKTLTEAGFMRPLTWESLAGILIQWTGTGFQNNLWFFTALFMTNLIFYLLYQGAQKCRWFRLKISVPLLAAAAWIFHRSTGILLPWYGDTACLVLPFFCLGYLVSEYGIQKTEGTFTLKNMLVSLSLSLIFTVIYVKYTGKHPDYHLSQAELPIIAYAAGSTGIFFLCSVGKWMENLRILKFVGENSLFYFAFGALGRFPGEAAAGMLGLPAAAVLICGILAELLLMIPVIYIGKRYFPVWFGIPKK